MLSQLKDWDQFQFNPGKRADSAFLYPNMCSPWILDSASPQNIRKCINWLLAYTLKARSDQISIQGDMAWNTHVAHLRKSIFLYCSAAHSKRTVTICIELTGLFCTSQFRSIEKGFYKGKQVLCRKQFRQQEHLTVGVGKSTYFYL